MSIPKCLIQVPGILEAIKHNLVDKQVEPDRIVLLSKDFKQAEEYFLEQFYDLPNNTVDYGLRNWRYYGFQVIHSNPRYNYNDKNFMTFRINL